MVIGKLPTWFEVPDNAPLMVNVRPVGSVPLLRVTLYGATPPVTVMAWL